MTDEVDGVLFSDGGNRVLLHSPQFYADGFGYHHRVDLVAGPFCGSIEASSYAPLAGIRSFRDQLAALYGDLKGEAHLPGAYENLSLSLRGDGLGHISVQVQADAGDALEIQLSFWFHIIKRICRRS